MRSLSLHPKQNKQLEKNIFFVKHIRMINLSLNKLKQIAKSRSIKDYKNKSKEYLKKILSESKVKITLKKWKISKKILVN